MSTDDKGMWEILVPTQFNCGKPIRTRYHRVWDKYVKDISGGLTIFSPVKGVWVSDKNGEFRERMIPVRISAAKEQMIDICRHTKKYYDQLAVIAYKVSDEVLYIDED